MDTELNTNKSPDEIMDQAADLIDIHGWNKGAFHTPDGRLCTMGALKLAVCPDIYQRDTSYMAIDAYPILYEAVDFIQSAKGINDAITYWNDETCRTEYQATELLRGQAKRYREERGGEH
jgi:hypothetical protein